VLYGFSGADSMRGGGGDDVYFVDNAGDRAIETSAGDGADTVKASVSYILGDNLEKLVLTGSGAINGTGNALDNGLTGNEAANNLLGRDGNDVMSGLGGNDRLYGGNGDDVIYGGAGTDWIEGGSGSDRLSGGSGADQFVFRDSDWDAGGSTEDYIRDFSHAEGDVIRLDYMDADTTTAGDQAFTFIGGAAFSGQAGELSAVQVGHNIVLAGDSDGDRIADIFIRVDGASSISAHDLIL
jgi:serralysin